MSRCKYECLVYVAHDKLDPIRTTHESYHEAKNNLMNAKDKGVDFCVYDRDKNCIANYEYYPPASITKIVIKALPEGA